jgi:hypothetical protein
VSRPSGSARTANSRERGAGLLGSVAGLVVFLCLLTVALQVLVNLHSASVVTAAAYDAARQAASGGTPLTDQQRDAAEAHARSMLGRVGDDTTFEWDESDPEVVQLRVVAPAPRFLLPVVDGALGLDVVDRTVTVRVEQLQP